MKLTLEACNRRCALLISSLLTLILFHHQATAIVFIDGGVAQSAGPTPVETRVARMPVVSDSSAFQPAGNGAYNLGSFDIVVNAGPNLALNGPALAAFQRAANLWKGYISDPITVVIDANVAPLGPGILGSAGSELLSASYNTIRNAMVADAADEGLDDVIVASLPLAANYTVTIPAGFGLDGNVFASKANLKALGFDPNLLDSVAGTATDVHITFSSNFNFDYDSSDGITAGQFDFEGVAAHEIGHGLGFFSGVDAVDFILPGVSSFIEPTPLDMFRFRDNVASDPATAVDFSNAASMFPRNMVPQHQAMFDQILPGGEAPIEVLFSQGLDFGDGRQASHWKDNLGLGLMDPTAAPGQLLTLTRSDLRAMDLIGYEISIPEPSSIALLLIGLGGAIIVRCRP